MTSCPLCLDQDCKLFKAGIRNVPEINVCRCQHCKAVFLSDFSDRGLDFYKGSGFIDAGQQYKGKTIEERLKHFHDENNERVKRYSSLMQNKRVLDFGCSAGGFLCAAEDSAASIVGIEPSEECRSYLKKKDKEVYSSLNALNQDAKFDVIFAFHVFEHLQNPLQTLKDLAAKLVQGGSIMIEVPNFDDIMLHLYDCKPYADFYFNREHLFYFNRDSLSWLIEAAGLTMQACQHIQRYDLSNHLHWLAKGQPGGHGKWGHLFQSRGRDSSYADALAAIGSTDTIVACCGT